ncbi:TPA: phage minor tail protein L [Morganella morganii]|nr:phage minor tail protein L [Morganella morganii]
MITNDYQKLEPGNAVRLFEVDGTAFGAPDILRFHAYNIPHTEAEITAAGGDPEKLPAKSIWWQGEEYRAWPVLIDGIEASTTGSGAQPKLSVANLDGSITALCLAYDDMLKAKVTIHDTLAHYLDAANFPDGNPSADPTQEKVSVFYIDSKSSETNEVIEFDLASPMDLQGVLIPTRQLHAMCTWCIRGKYKSGDGCDYAGQNGYFDKHGNRVDDPAQDQCSGMLNTGCFPRFGKNNPIPFGGFPGTSLLRK